MAVPILVGDVRCNCLKQLHSAIFMPNTKNLSKLKAEDFKFLTHVYHFQPHWYEMARQASTSMNQLKLDEKNVVLNIGKGTSNKIVITTQRSKGKG